MATAASTMASQLKSSFASSLTKGHGLVTPKGISGAPFKIFPSTRKSSFTVKAVQADKPTFQVIQPLNGDPFIGSLETPVTSSPLIAWYLSNLPAYRTAVNPLLRGVEVGLAHGFLLVGPFVKAGPLRNTEYAGGAGSLAAAGLVVILSICLTIYGISSFKEGDPSTAPALTLTGRKKVPDQLQTADGWAKFTGGFFFGGISGVIWAYFLLYVLDLPYFVKNTGSSGKTSVVVIALDGVINVNSLFTIAIFVGLSLASPGQKSLNSRQNCQPGILTVKQLVIFEVLSFSFFLFSSLVAQAAKLSLSLLHSEDFAHGFSVVVNATLLRTGMLMTAISSVMGCLFLMVSMLNVIEIKTGMLFCGAKSTITSVTFLVVLVSSGILVYISAAWYAFIHANIHPHETRAADRHSPSA